MAARILEAALTDSLQTYWRIKAGVAIFQNGSDTNPFSGQLLNYANIPACRTPGLILKAEPVNQTFQEVDRYVSSGQLSTAFFLRMVSHIESFLSDLLAVKGLDQNGTFGNLQLRCQGAYAVTGSIVDHINEIRERRNVLIHHSGQVTPKYIIAAQNIYMSSNGVIVDPTTVTNLNISDQYLSYAADTLIIYGRQF